MRKAYLVGDRDAVLGLVPALRELPPATALLLVRTLTELGEGARATDLLRALVERDPTDQPAHTELGMRLAAERTQPG